MANEKRRRYLSIGGTIDDAPLAAGATTLNSTELGNLPAVTSTDHVALVLDPLRTGGAPEIVYVTAHTASATSATIVRGREGTVDRAHNATIEWVHGPTPKDFDGTDGGSGLIGLTSYNPGTVQTQTATASTADLDATNLVVAFVAPPSGKVLVRLSALARKEASAAAYLRWGLRSGTDPVVGIQGVALEWTAEARHAAEIVVEGLTPGTSYSWKWTQIIGTNTGRTKYGGEAGAAVMQVWAVAV